jgi:hypothetical protein
MPASQTSLASQAGQGQGQGPDSRQGQGQPQQGMEGGDQGDEDLMLEGVILPALSSVSRSSRRFTPEADKGS